MTEARNIQPVSTPAPLTLEDLQERRNHYVLRDSVVSRAIDELIRLRFRQGLIADAVASQAKDEALWFLNVSAGEAYLQQELRRLHRTIEEGVPYVSPD